MLIKKIAAIIFLLSWGTLFVISKQDHGDLLSELKNIDENSVSEVYIYDQGRRGWVNLERHAASIGKLFSTAASDLESYSGRPQIVEPRTLVRIKAYEKCYDKEFSGQDNPAFKMYLAVGRASCGSLPEFPVNPGSNGFYSSELKALRQLLQQLRDPSQPGTAGDRLQYVPTARS